MLLRRDDEEDDVGDDAEASRHGNGDAEGRTPAAARPRSLVILGIRPLVAALRRKQNSRLRGYAPIIKEAVLGFP